MITHIIIAQNEPDWIKNANYSVPKILDPNPKAADAKAFTDDEHVIYIERKTPDDFLNTLKDKRLFPEIERMTAERNEQIKNNQPVTFWAYLIITDNFGVERGTGKVITDRGVTGWSFEAVQGALLSIQEVGCYVVFCNGQADYADCITRIGKRNRSPEMGIAPARIVKNLGDKIDFISGLPGIGLERAQEILEWAGDSPAVALLGITDESLSAPIGQAGRKKIKKMLEMEHTHFELVPDEGNF